MRMSHLKTTIGESILPVATELGLGRVGDDRFCGVSEGIVRMVTVVFLDRRHAATFGTCTASFSIEVGVWYPDRGDSRVPVDVGEVAHVQCQVRQLLQRDLRQPPPSADLAAPDRARRDIWWVDRDGGNLAAVTASAAHVVRRQAPRSFRRFADPRRARRFFRAWRITQWLPHGPMTVGRPGSPAHRQLLRLLDG